MFTFTEMPKVTKPIKTKKEPKSHDDDRNSAKDGHKLSNYNKKRMLQILKNTNCNPESEKDLSKGYRSNDKVKITKGTQNDHFSYNKIIIHIQIITCVSNRVHK